MPSLKAYFLGNDASCLLNQSGIPRGRHTQPCGENGCSDGHVPVRCLLGEEEWNTQTGIFLHVLLQGVAAFGGQFWIQTVGKRLPGPWVGTVGGPQHADVTLLDVLFELVAGHHVAALYVVVVPRQRAAQLSDLLFEGHAGEQVADALLHGKALVLVRERFLLRGVGRQREAEHGEKTCKFLHSDELNSWFWEKGKSPFGVMKVGFS